MNGLPSESIYILTATALWSLNSSTCHTSLISNLTLYNTVLARAITSCCEQNISVVFSQGDHAFVATLHYRTGEEIARHNLPEFMQGYRLILYSANCANKQEIAVKSKFAGLLHYAWYDSQLLRLQSNTLEQYQSFDRTVNVRWSHVRKLQTVSTVSSTADQQLLVITNSGQHCITTATKKTWPIKKGNVSFVKLNYRYSISSTQLLLQIYHLETCAYKCAKSVVCRGFSYSPAADKCCLYNALRFTSLDSTDDSVSYIIWV